jgi:hypothetical protein
MGEEGILEESWHRSMEGLGNYQRRHRNWEKTFATNLRRWTIPPTVSREFVSFHAAPMMALMARVTTYFEASPDF